MSWAERCDRQYMPRRTREGVTTEAFRLAEAAANREPSDERRHGRQRVFGLAWLARQIFANVSRITELGSFWSGLSDACCACSR